MKRNDLLTIASLLSILLLTFHLTQDTLHQGGMPRVGFFSVVLIMAVWLYGTLLLTGRRAGYVIMFIGSIIAMGMPVLHTWRAGVSKNSGWFTVWTLFAIGVTGAFSFILAVRGLSSPQWGDSK
jgi:hypothetical protein